jgi:hypothetical protein
MGKKSREKKLRKDTSVRFLGEATPDGVFSYWGCKLEGQKAVIVARNPERAIAKFLEIRHLIPRGGENS